MGISFCEHYRSIREVAAGALVGSAKRGSRLPTLNSRVEAHAGHETLDATTYSDAGRECGVTFTTGVSDGLKHAKEIPAY